MAVTALPGTSASAPLEVATLQPAVLVLTLIAPVFDLLAIVQPGAAVPPLGLLGAGLASAALLVSWVRYPRTSWLAAASLASLASLALRFAGADIASALSLLSIVALGVGGAFATSVPEAEAWLA